MLTWAAFFVWVIVIGEVSGGRLVDLIQEHSNKTSEIQRSNLGSPWTLLPLDAKLWVITCDRNILGTIPYHVNKMFKALVHVLPIHRYSASILAQSMSVMSC